MNKEEAVKGDKALMIVSYGMIFIGIVALFFSITLGIILTAVGIGMFVMGYVSKKPKTENE